MSLDPPQEKIARFRRAFVMAHGKAAPRIFWDGEKYVWPKGHPMPPRTPDDFDRMTKRLVSEARKTTQQS